MQIQPLKQSLVCSFTCLLACKFMQLPCSFRKVMYSLHPTLKLLLVHALTALHLLHSAWLMPLFAGPFISSVLCRCVPAHVQVSSATTAFAVIAATLWSPSNLWSSPSRTSSRLDLLLLNPRSVSCLHQESPCAAVFRLSPVVPAKYYISN